MSLLGVGQTGKVNMVLDCWLCRLMDRSALNGGFYLSSYKMIRTDLVPEFLAQPMMQSPG
jgi:hypothetical protein